MKLEEKSWGAKRSGMEIKDVTKNQHHPSVTGRAPSVA